MTTSHRMLVDTQCRLQEGLNRLITRLVHGQERRARLARGERVGRVLPGERGDVPGWVMITLMTAGLVAIIWAVAEDQFQALFNDAINDVRR